MEIAAVNTVSVAPQSRLLSNTFSRKLGSVSSLSLRSIEREHRVGSARLRVSAASSSSSMDAVTAEKISPASFLENRESKKVLHFVKYHGLGNDFILVTLVSVNTRFQSQCTVSKDEDFSFLVRWITETHRNLRSLKSRRRSSAIGTSVLVLMELSLQCRESMVLITQWGYSIQMEVNQRWAFFAIRYVFEWVLESQRLFGFVIVDVW